MNKFLAIACLATVATAAPEADADAFYSTYGYGLGHYGYGLGAYGYAGYPYAHHGYAHHAYAAPVATGYAHVSPSASLSIAGLANAAVPAVAGGYAGAGRYVANSAGVVHVAKRSADAEAEADADAFYTTYGYAGLPYAGYSGYTGYPYHHAAYNYAAYSPYSYGLGYAAYAAPAAVKTVEVEAPAVVKTVAAPAIAAPLAYHHAIAAPVATGYAQVNHATSLSTAGLAAAAIPAVAGGYAGAGRYVANSAGVVHVA